MISPPPLPLPATPKETGRFSEPWTVQTAKEEKHNSNNYNILKAETEGLITAAH